MSKAEFFDRLPHPLLLAINQFGYISIPAAIFAVLFVVFGLTGFTPAEIGILAALAIVAFVFWWRAHARQSANVPASETELRDSIGQSGKYAMLAFESEFCMSSSSVGKQLAELESAYPDRFQIYSISVLQNPGKQLFAEYDGRVTPTYVLLDASGKVVMDFPLVLPVERVMYAVSQETARL